MDWNATTEFWRRLVKIWNGIIGNCLNHGLSGLRRLHGLKPLNQRRYAVSRLSSSIMMEEREKIDKHTKLGVTPLAKRG